MSLALYLAHGEPIPVYLPTRLDTLRALARGLPVSQEEVRRLHPGDVQRELGAVHLTESTAAALAVLDRVALAAADWSYPMEIARRARVAHPVVVDALDLLDAEAADDGSGRRLWRVVGR